MIIIKTVKEIVMNMMITNVTFVSVKIYYARN